MNIPDKGYQPTGSQQPTNPPTGSAMFTPSNAHECGQCASFDGHLTCLAGKSRGRVCVRISTACESFTPVPEYQFRHPGIPGRAQQFFNNFCLPRYIKGDQEYGNRIDQPVMTVQQAIEETAEELADALLYIMRARELAAAIQSAPTPHIERPAGLRVFIGTNAASMPNTVTGFIVLDEEDPQYVKGEWLYRHGKGQFLEFYQGQSNLPKPGEGIWLW